MHSIVDDIIEGDAMSLVSNAVVINEISAKSALLNVPIQDLKPRVLLHLPKYSKEELKSKSVISQETERIAYELKGIYSLHPVTLGYDLTGAVLSDFVLEISSEDDVHLIIGNLHYLRSIREDSIYLSLIHRKLGLCVGIATISSNDLTHLTFELPGEQVMVLSRFYTLSLLPPNANSYFIGLLCRWIRTNFPSAKFLTTYLNKNVGFSGTIYKSTNWDLIAREHNTRYAYINGVYISWRSLHQKLGLSSQEELSAEHISYSQIDLMALEIYSLPLYRNLPRIKFQNVLNPYL